ncbi:FecR domain-containing protein [Spirosoma sp. BT702]|uniref:FecR domain-containing protein n=1 Tax=Spirosoma profusum TaxID=2771354 RepID=A0A927ARI4_9BACT|nr:FecR domain-containing protein [Spirosoma profusum]MBD2699810.1 FecR domain-containing protein [Spirosoma profusum]
MKPQVSKESLFNYFAGRATALQKQQIDEWAKEEQNRELFFECLAIWENQNIQFVADVQDAMQRHTNRMISEPDDTNAPVSLPEVVERPLGAGSLFRWLVAATVAGVLLVSGVRFSDKLIYTTYQAPFGQTRSITLSDGSRITLNANSTLQVPRFGFGQRTRKVILAGEADFAIKHMPNHQKFIVQTNKNFEVVVLGTEFMVNTREHGRKVILNKGKVQLLYQEGEMNKQLTMKPGNLVLFDRQGHVSLKQAANPQELRSWKVHRFVFDQTTLEEISTLFRENYSIYLDFPDEELRQWAVSGAFTANNAEELIEALTSASNLTYKRQGDTLIVVQPH